MGNNAKTFEFLLSQVRASGAVLSGGKVYFYKAGLPESDENKKTVWQDRGKNTEAANPYTLDANGTAQVFGDGLYRVIIKDASLVTKYDWDNISVREISGELFDMTDYATLNAAVTALGSGKATLQFSSDITVDANLVIPANIELYPVNGAKVVHGGYTISYAGPSTRWPVGAQIFNGDGLVSGIADLTPEMLGAVGDGATDNTAVFKQLAASAATAKKITFTGNYYLNNIVTSGSQDDDINFTGLNGCTLDFVKGAKIKLRANFEHKTNARSINIIFRSCTDLTINNIEIDGQISTGTKTGTEQGEHGLQFFGCKNVTLNNAKPHDCANDGLYIDHIYTAGAITTESRNFTVNNLDSYNNGRQSMSLIGLFNGDFNNCKFRDTGKTGSFGSYSPGAGVDLEPNATTYLQISHITFRKCLFGGNIGPCFVGTNLGSTSSFDGSVDYINIYDPQFVPDATSTGAGQVILAVQHGGIYGGYSDFTAMSGVTNPQIQLGYGDYYTNVQLHDHTIKGPNCCLIATKHASRTRYEQQVDIRRCRIISTDPTATGEIRPTIDVGGNFINNYVYVPDAAYAAGPGTRTLVKLNNLFRVEGNQYKSDVTAGKQVLVDMTGVDHIAHETYLDSTTIAPTPYLYNEKPKMLTRAVMLTTLSYGATINTDAATGTIFVITITDGNAFTIANPTNPTYGQEIAYRFRNTSGGAAGSVTWGTAFKTSTTTVMPTTAFSREITFYYNGTNWIQRTTTGDVAN